MMSNEPTSPNQTLRETIEAWAAQHASEFPPEVYELFEAKAEEVLRTNILKNPLKVGDKSPDFVLSDQSGNEIQFSDCYAQGPVILSFYRGTWCPYCNFEFQALLESMPQFQFRGASVIAISPQISERSPDTEVVGFLDLPDPGNKVARTFGLVYPLGEEIRNVYTKFGIRLEPLNGDDSYEVPVPATYVVDREGVIRFAYASADFKERAEPEALLRILAEIDLQ